MHITNNCKHFILYYIFLSNLNHISTFAMKTIFTIIKQNIDSLKSPISFHTYNYVWQVGNVFMLNFHHLWHNLSILTLHVFKYYFVVTKYTLYNIKVKFPKNHYCSVQKIWHWMHTFQNWHFMHIFHLYYTVFIFSISNVNYTLYSTLNYILLFLIVSISYWPSVCSIRD